MRSSSSMTARPTARREALAGLKGGNPANSGCCAMTATWARAGASAPGSRRPRARSSSPWTATARTTRPTFPSCWRRSRPIRGSAWCRASGSSAKTPPAGGWRRGWATAFAIWLLGDGASDTGCGLKVFRRQAFLDLPYFDHIHRFLIALMLREGVERGLCAGQSPPAPDRPVQIHQLRAPAGQRPGSAGRALAAAAPSREERDTGAINGLSLAMDPRSGPWMQNMTAIPAMPLDRYRFCRAGLIRLALFGAVAHEAR